MDTQEKLSSENIKMLQMNVSVARKVIMLIALLVFIVVIMLVSSISSLNGYIIGGVGFILFVVMFFLVKRVLKQLEKDIENGFKTIFEDKIEDKMLGNSKDYILFIRNDRQLVTKQQYDMVAIGDSVRVAVASYSGTLLEIEKINK